MDPSPSRAALTLGGVVVLASLSSARGGEGIFGEPQFWGIAHDFGTVAGDFDGDGDVDLFTVHPPTYDSFGQLVDPGDYTINFNVDGQGSFSMQTITAAEGAYGVFARDLNGDGALDVIDDDIGVMLGHGDGTFGPIIVYSNGHGTSHALGFGDMDDDGDIDIVAPNNGPVLLNHGDGTFATEFVSSDVAGGIGVAVGDVDEDGHLDIVTVDGFGRLATVQLGLGDGFGNPGPPYTVGTGADAPADVVLTDMNGDAHLDLVTLNQGNETVSVVPGAGDGTFGSPATFAPHPPAYYIVEVFQVADVTGDGAPDVIVTCTVYGDAESHVETGVLINDGTGALALEQTVERFGQHDENIAVADLNDDGNLDLATATDLLFNQLPATIGMGVAPHDDLVSVGPYGGPFEPASKTYTLTNNDDAAIEYSAAADADWLTVEPGGGSIPPGDSVDIMVSINGTAEVLGNGDYHATVAFVNLTSHHGDHTREIDLQVGLPQIAYMFPLDADPGWQSEGLWEYGAPTGQGGQHGSPDPTSGYTGPNVYGYNLHGDYEALLPETNLTTTAIDCSNLGHVTLRFRRWLGVQDVPDRAYVRLSTDGSFFTYIWINETEVYDDDWQLVEYDLSPFADGKPTVYVQWTMGPMSGFGTACGWNIDDVEIFGVVQGVPCTGDVDGDGAVGVSDLLALLGAWGPNPGHPADFDGDGDVGVSDLLTLLGGWGTCP